MKKILLSLSLIVGLSYAAQAQGLKFGVKAGASLTNITGISGISYKLGFHGGLQADYGINTTFSIRSELLYSMNGYKIETFKDNIAQTLHYFELPVLAHVQAKNLFFEVGPQLGILVAASSIDNPKDASASFTVGDNKSYFNPVDFGYTVGIGYQLPIGAGIGLRYTGSLTDIYKSSLGITNSHNRSFQLYLSYLFGDK